jgi:uncharacterized membrane protein YidH (DUF202 family)
VEQTGRVGWAARGVLYLLVAILVARVPTTGSARKADQRGALQALGDRPFGGALLVAIAVGLFAFAVFRAYEAARAGDEKTTRRLGWGVSAIVYAHIAFTAVRVLVRPEGGGDEQRALTARVLGWPGGPILIAAVGLGVIVAAANFARKAIKERFRVDIDDAAVPRPASPVVKVVGVAGWLGRSLVWGLVGWFLVRAAFEHDAKQPVGLDETLRALVGETWGVAVIWVAVAGLTAFALLCFATATWLDERT